MQLDAQTSYQPWISLAASVAATKTLSVALEPHAFADAAPNATHDVGVIAAVALAVHPWLVIDAGVDLVATTPRSVSALVGMTIVPVRLWGP